MFSTIQYCRPSNVSLGVGTNRLTIMIVDVSRPEPWVINTYTVVIERQTADHSCPAFTDDQPHQVCSLAQVSCGPNSSGQVFLKNTIYCGWVWKYVLLSLTLWPLHWPSHYSAKVTHLQYVYHHLEKHWFNLWNLCAFDNVLNKSCHIAV